MIDKVGGQPDGVYRRCGCKDPATGRRWGSRCPRLADPDHGTWYFAVQATDPRGHRIRLRRGGYDSPAAAQAARNAVADHDLHERFGEVATVRDWLYSWLADIEGTVRPTTWQAYRSHVVEYLSPGIGRIPLQELTTGEIQHLFDGLGKRVNRYADPLAPATLQRIRATLRRSLNIAVREQVLRWNPVLGLVLPGGRRSRPTVWSRNRVDAWRLDGWRPVVGVWTVDQLAGFLDGVEDDPLYGLWHLAALTGLRRGELLGLKWIDVDLDSRELTVCRQRTEITGQIIDSLPKTDAGVRTIALDRDTSQALECHRLSDWSSPAADGFVFCWPDGRPLRPDWLTHRFAELLKQLKLPPIRLHDLRHGAATLALSAGADVRVVQEMLGHTNYAFTADTYVSVLSAQSRAAVDGAAEAVRAKRARPHRAITNTVHDRGGRLGG
ncbi:integrase [Hamadaea flava]|uniref:Tyrosine-type recombinase/integrase n=1 Tax=Hamadaea flava TaxID=1742688 RepID=A0ABV8LZ13_9ACTN|nr:site-specific integrase [Hamadaea flava]MCP2326990.1 integrase [Hamadaea flava]